MQIYSESNKATDIVEGVINAPIRFVNFCCLCNVTTTFFYYILQISFEKQLLIYGRLREEIFHSKPHGLLVLHEYICDLVRGLS